MMNIFGTNTGGTRDQVFVGEMSRGFTLLEMLLVLALFAVLGGIAVPMYRSQWVSNDLRSAESALVSSLYRASMLASSGAEDDAWGVQVSRGEVTVFRGDEYIDNPDSYEVIHIAESLEITGDMEISFHKNTGLPADPVVMELRAEDTKSFELVVSEIGVIDVVYE